ncbi:MAG: hypothetical protein IKA71_03395 [Lentisphaeria bacterium]|nr:hypothetical protein [Lentisphaeria bacterium]
MLPTAAELIPGDRRRQLNCRNIENEFQQMGCGKKYVKKLFFLVEIRLERSYINGLRGFFCPHT